MKQRLTIIGGFFWVCLFTSTIQAQTVWTPQTSGTTEFLTTTQFVDAMTDHAESVLVCEKQDGNTSLTRLSQKEIDTWRKHGSLGSLWMSGHIGGTRW